ncbi:MAG TPA: ATP-dependent sacrificial sulfur transferase LarE, partial [Acidimicrobiales bacterium]|nr:ATP-dependent sacrificial sulfur transferase LarE [Acidimicrobiales bacterium]
MSEGTLGALEDVLRGLGRVVVAFSGGADSAFLARVAHDTLGADRAHAVTAVSESLAPEERDDCAALAREWGLSWSTVATNELGREEYRANDAMRCFYCKSELMDALAPLGAADGATVVLGVNVDDLTDHRPGQKAAAERGARFPLVEAGFTKAMVRERSRALGLRTWDKPAAACLASRVPYGTPV